MSVVVTLASPVDFEAWRVEARALLMRGVSPDDVVWRVEGDEELLPLEREAPPNSLISSEIRIPRRFVELADLAIRHRDPRALCAALSIARAARRRAAADRARDRCGCRGGRRHGQVRLPRPPQNDGLRALPRARGRGAALCRVVRARTSDRGACRFVLRRPLCVDGVRHFHAAPRDSFGAAASLTFGPGGRPGIRGRRRRFLGGVGCVLPLDLQPRPAHAAGDAQGDAEEILGEPAGDTADRAARRRCGAGGSNPAHRARRDARKRRPARLAATSVPAAAEPLDKLADEAKSCTRCPLYQNATQVVFGQGPEDARVMFVGEQPGDKEDLAGVPFVGPAGAVFDEALAAAGLDRSQCYVTGAVKHFKFTSRARVRCTRRRTRRRSSLADGGWRRSSPPCRRLWWWRWGRRLCSP